MPITIAKTWDYYSYVPPDVINPKVFSPIPPDAVTYKITPSTTLFFKKATTPLSIKFNFGLHNKSSTKIRIKSMFKKCQPYYRAIKHTYPGYPDEYDDVTWVPDKNYLYSKYRTKERFAKTDQTGIPFNSRKRFSVGNYGGECEAFKAYCLNKEIKKIPKEKRTVLMNLAIESYSYNTDIFLNSMENDVIEYKHELKKRKEISMIKKAVKKKQQQTFWGKVTAFFSSEPEIIAPSAPPYNPDYQTATANVTTINNINVKIECKIF